MQNVRSRSYLSYCDFSSWSVICRNPDVTFRQCARAIAVLQSAGGGGHADGQRGGGAGVSARQPDPEQVQQQTVDDMTGSMNLARDTANVATAAVRLSQVVGRWNTKVKRNGYRRPSARSSIRWNSWPAPLAQQEPGLVERIIQRSNELQSSVEGMLQRGQLRHQERNALLSSLYQNQSYLRHLQNSPARRMMRC